MAFDEYAAYYDVLYQDKKYKEEADFVAEEIKNILPNANSIIEFGCGTGIHAEFLNPHFPKMRGMDLSPGMVKQANERKRNFIYSKDIQFIEGDIRKTKFDFKADSVVSLFHVMSYQTCNNSLRASIQNAAAHLKAGGVFLFDFWYGPAVLEQRPSRRKKEMENSHYHVEREAIPIHDENNCIVNVHFDVSVKEKSSGEIKKISENHLMRYFFLPEIKLCLEQFNFEVVKTAEFKTNKKIGLDTWGIYIIAKLNNTLN